LGARFRTAGRREKGWAYLLVARKGPEEDLEGPDGDLGTRRRATAAAAQSSPCVRERAHAGERERYFGFLHAFLSVCASPSPWADRPSMHAKILENADSSHAVTSSLPSTLQSRSKGRDRFGT